MLNKFGAIRLNQPESKVGKLSPGTSISQHFHAFPWSWFCSFIMFFMYRHSPKTLHTVHIWQMAKWDNYNRQEYLVRILHTAVPARCLKADYYAKKKKWSKTERSRIFDRNNNYHIVIRCATFSWFCDFDNFSWGNQQENRNRTTRYEMNCSTPCWAIKRNAAPLGELRKAGRWSSKELSLSQGALALKKHELLTAVVVTSAKKHDLIVSSDSSPRGHKLFLPV